MASWVLPLLTHAACTPGAACRVMAESVGDWSICCCGGSAAEHLASHVAITTRYIAPYLDCLAGSRRCCWGCSSNMWGAAILCVCLCRLLS